MGYNLHVIAVDLAKVRGALGSRNGQLLKDVIAGFQEEFGEIDRMAAEYAEDFDVENLATCSLALRQMIHGEKYGEPSFVYGYCLEFLCHHLGEDLPNDDWSAMPSAVDWFEEVDKSLKKAGVATEMLSAQKFFFRGAPVPLPRIDDDPSLGYITRQEAERCYPLLSDMTLSQIKSRDARESVRQLRGWLKHCIDRRLDLTTFCA